MEQPSATNTTAAPPQAPVRQVLRKTSADAAPEKKEEPKEGQPAERDAPAPVVRQEPVAPPMPGVGGVVHALIPWQIAQKAYTSVYAASGVSVENYVARLAPERSVATLAAGPVAV